jgi:hypothetical protein
VVARYAGRDATWGIPYSYPVYFLNHHDAVPTGKTVFCSDEIYCVRQPENKYKAEFSNDFSKILFFA